MKHRLLSVLAATILSGSAGSQPLAIPEAPPAALEQRIGAQLPLEMRLADELGRPVRLGDYFANGRPVLLVLGYYRCRQLCGLLMHGLLEGLRDSRMPRQRWRIVGLSIDPGDTPVTARARREADQAYADFLDSGYPRGTPLDLHLLTAAAADSQQLAARVGFRYARTANPGENEAAAPYAHPAAVIVVTPAGKVSRYLMGVRFEPAELDSALEQAARGEVGTVSERIALLCAHFDPQWGRHSEDVMNGLRAGGLLLVAALGSWCWRRRAAASGTRR